jgi:AcrR family transcriptional regulator
MNPSERSDFYHLLRRMPTQTRSIERVDLILATAAELIAEAGVDALTTAAIAQRAGIAVSGVYDFFDSADVVVEALALQHRRLLGDLYERLFAAIPDDSSLRETVEAVVRGLDRFHRRHPALAVLLQARADDLGRTVSDAFAARVEAFVRDRKGFASPRWRIVADTVVDITGAMLGRAATVSPRKRRAVVDELVNVLVAYLEADAFTR